MKKNIISKLTEKFNPQILEVVDESEKHRGHKGYREGGNSHFRIKIKAETLNGLTRLQQHRTIMQCLDAELANDIHALAIDIIK